MTPQPWLCEAHSTWNTTECDACTDELIAMWEEMPEVSGRGEITIPQSAATHPPT